MVAFGIEPKRRALNSSEDEPRDSTLIYSCTCGTSTSIGWRSVNQRQPGWSFMLPLRGGFDHFYPLRSVTITSRDPGYMTPEIKFLLRRRNRLMHHQKIE